MLWIGHIGTVKCRSDINIQSALAGERVGPHEPKSCL